MKTLSIIFMCVVFNISSVKSQNKIQVNQPKNSVAVELLKMNVLYVGVDNPVNIAVAGEDKFTVAMAKGTVAKNENIFVIKETIPGVDTLFIYDSENQIIDKRLYRVKPLQKPQACIGDKCSNSGISKNVLLAQRGIIAVYYNLDFELYAKVTNFQMTISKPDNQILSLESSNNLFTDEMKKVMETLDIGTKIIFEEIDAVGPGGQKMRLAPLELTLK